MQEAWVKPDGCGRGERRQEALADVGVGTARWVLHPYVHRSGAFLGFFRMVNWWPCAGLSLMCGGT